MKVCKKCKNDFPIDLFYREKKNKNGLTARCKKCIDEVNKNYAEKNKERVRKNSERHYVKNIEVIKQRAREYEINNQEYVNEKRRLKYNSDSEYRKTKALICRMSRIKNPNTARLAKHRRRSSERQQINAFTREQWNECLRIFNKKCAYCGESKELTQDHFFPVSLGGEYTVKNILPCCSWCNSSKGNRLFSQWYAKQKFYSISRKTKILKYLGYKDGTQQMALI